MESVARKKYATKSRPTKPPTKPPTKQKPLNTPPPKTPTPPPQNSPPQTQTDADAQSASALKTPTRTTKTTTPPKSPTPTKEPSPEPQPIQIQMPTSTAVKEKTPAAPTEPTLISANITVKNLQAIPEAAEEEETEAVDASAPSAAASEGIPAVTIIPKNQEDTIRLVLEELAAKKREELGNTQKFFKQVAKGMTAEKETPQVGDAEVSQEKDQPGEKETSKDTVETETREEEATQKDKPEEQEDKEETEPEKQTAAIPSAETVLTGASAPDASAPSADAPQNIAGASAPIQGEAAATGSTIPTKPKPKGAPAETPKPKKKKMAHAPTRASNRLRSGAKHE